MTRYARLNDTSKVIEREVDGDREFRGGVAPAMPNRPYTWLPVVEVGKSTLVDGATQTKEGPVEVITATEVTRTWTVRAKTTTELDQTIAASNDLTTLVNTLVNAPVLNSTDFPKKLIDRVNARNRLDGSPEI